MTEYPFVPLRTFEEFPVEEMRQRLAAFYETVNRRRTVREFSDRPVPVDIVETALRAAGGYPADDAVIPDINRKALQEYMSVVDD